MYSTLYRVEGTLGKRGVQGVQRDMSFWRFFPPESAAPRTGFGATAFLYCWKGTAVTPVVQCELHLMLGLGFGATQPVPGSARSLTLGLPSSARAQGRGCRAGRGDGTQHKRRWN